MTMCFNELFTLYKHTAGTAAAIVHSAVIKRTQNGNQSSSAPTRPEPVSADSDGFMNIPDSIDEELPFKA